MKIGIMQPYFMPYLGYFQLINTVDKFIVYDNIQYTKKGWINRNRILVNGMDVYITIPLEKDSDYLDVLERKISNHIDREKLLCQICGAYNKAPYFKDVYEIIREIVYYSEENLFSFINNSIKSVNCYLKISTEVVVSSSIDIDHSLKGQDKVLAICNDLGADSYINPIGGKGLYDKSMFQKRGIELSFLKMDNLIYKQFNEEFVPSLSIIDVLMFNSIEEIHFLLEKYKLE